MVPDYRKVTLTLYYMQGLQQHRVEIPSAIDPEPFEESFQPDLKRQISKLVPPATYDLIVTGRGPQLFDLAIDAVPASLPRDRFDRRLSPPVAPRIFMQLEGQQLSRRINAKHT
ncbi:MAG: hypothetical protein ACREX9_08170 [Gammaproteobacteria bacterium]